MDKGGFEFEGVIESHDPEAGAFREEEAAKAADAAEAVVEAGIPEEDPEARNRRIIDEHLAKRGDTSAASHSTDTATVHDANRDKGFS